jgi:hypothetical protein
MLEPNMETMLISWYKLSFFYRSGAIFKDSAYKASLYKGSVRKTAARGSTTVLRRSSTVEF